MTHGQSRLFAGKAKKNQQESPRFQNETRLPKLKKSSLSSMTAPEFPAESPCVEPVLGAEVASSGPPSLSARGTRIARSLLDRLPGGRFTRSVVVLAGGTAMGQAVSIAAAPVITRLYSPADYGAMGVYTSLLAIFCVVASLRYELAILLPEKDEDAAATVVLSLAIISFTVSIFGLGVWWLHVEIIQWTNTPALGLYLWLLPVGVAWTGVYNVFNYWAIRKKAFGLIARTRLFQRIAAVITKIGGYPFGLVGLLLGNIVAASAGIVSLVAFVVREDRNLFNTTNCRAMVRMAARYRRFPQISSVSGIMNATSLHLPMLMLAAFYGQIVTGQFALVLVVATYPTGFLGQAVGQVYLGEGASAVRNSPSTLYHLFLPVTKRMSVIAIVPMLVLVTLGPSLFVFVFGREWREAGEFARVLAPMMACQFVVSPLGSTLNLLERQAYLLAWDCFRITLVVASLGLPAFLGWTAITAIGVYSGVMIVAYVVLWILIKVTISCAIRDKTMLESNPNK